MKRAPLIFYQSDNGGVDWAPVKPAQVPLWLNQPDLLGRLAAGEMCSDPVQGPQWWRAENYYDACKAAANGP